MKRSAQAAVNDPPRTGSGVRHSPGAKAASSNESGRGVASIIESGQGDTSSPADVAADDSARTQDELNFDPNLTNRPTIDAAIHRLRARQQVRILNPDTNKIEDVTIRNGFKRKNERSWYRVVDNEGNRKVFDFNEIVWDFKYNETLLTRRSRIEPNKTFRVHHTIIHPSQHHLPGVIEAKTKEIENHSKFGTFDMVRESSLNEQQKSRIIPSTWAIVYKARRSRINSV